MRKTRCFNIILQCGDCLKCDYLNEIDAGAFTDLVVSTYEAESIMGYPCTRCEAITDHDVGVCAHTTREDWDENYG